MSYLPIPPCDIPQPPGAVTECPECGGPVSACYSRIVPWTWNKKPTQAMIHYNWSRCRKCNIQWNDPVLQRAHP